MLQVGRAVFARRRAHGDELHATVGYGMVHIPGKSQPPATGVAQHDIEQAGLVDGQLAAQQGGDAPGVAVQADHVVAHLREAGACHQAHVSGSDNGDVHEAAFTGV